LYELARQSNVQHPSVELIATAEGYVLEVIEEAGATMEFGTTLLQNMRARADLVGGSLETGPGADGTQYLRLRLPRQILGVMGP